MRRPTTAEKLMYHLSTILNTYGAIDISPEMEIGFCVSRRSLLKAAKSLVKDPIGFNKISIVTIDGITLLVGDDFTLSDFDLRYIPTTKEEIDAYRSIRSNVCRCDCNRHLDSAKN